LSTILSFILEHQSKSETHLGALWGSRLNKIPFFFCRRSKLKSWIRSQSVAGQRLYRRDDLTNDADGDNWVTPAQTLEWDNWIRTDQPPRKSSIYIERKREDRFPAGYLISSSALGWSRPLDAEVQNRSSQRDIHPPINIE
jgi:hypothetical protein